MNESCMSLDAASRPSVQMLIEGTETLIDLHMKANAANADDSLEHRSLEFELDNRYQFMLYQRDQGAI